MYYVNLQFWKLAVIYSFVFKIFNFIVKSNFNEIYKIHLCNNQIIKNHKQIFKIFRLRTSNLFCFTPPPPPPKVFL